MPPKEIPYFERLVTCALTCSHYRVLCSIYDDRFAPKLNEAGNEAVAALKGLAAHCRATGRDARNSPLYESFGGLAWHYDDTYERWRPVSCEVLTPRVIFDAVEKGNKLSWGEWTIKASTSRELTDDYGLPAWDRVVTIFRNGESQASLEICGRPRHRALEIYKLITGETFTGDDGIERDSPHRYEHGMDVEYY